MISLVNVTMRGRNDADEAILLNSLYLHAREKERVGIYAASGSGKTMLAKLISGLIKPDDGAVLHSGRVGWPIAFAGFLHPRVSVRGNLTILSRLIGEDPVVMLEKVSDFCGSAKLGDMRVEQLSPAKRALFAYACSVVPQFDYYVADDQVSVGDRANEKRCRDLLETRLECAGIIFVGRNVRLLSEVCERRFAIINGRLVECASFEDAERAASLAAELSSVEMRQELRI